MSNPNPKIPINATPDLTTIKRPIVYGSIMVLIIILISVTLALLFTNTDSPQLNANGKTPTQSEIETILIVLSFVVAIFAIMLLTIPAYKDLLTFFSKLSGVFRIILYIIGLVILFRTLPADTMNSYAYIISPVTLLVGIFLFYLVLKKDISEIEKHANFEKMNYLITFFCLIIFMLVFYMNDPGGYIKQYFGISLVFSILLAVFGFLFLMTAMTFPNKDGNDPGKTSILQNFSTFSIISVVGFVVFLIVAVVGILTYPGGFLTGTSGVNNMFSDKTNKVSLIIILLVAIFFLWIMYFFITLFSDLRSNGPPGDASGVKGISNIYKRIFMLLFGLIFSGILIAWIISIYNNLSSSSGIVSFVLNLLIILSILGLVYKLLVTGTMFEKSPLYRLIVNSVLYIPCVFVTIFDYLLSFLGAGASGITAVSKNGVSGLSAIGTNISQTPSSYYALLGLIAVLYVLYFTYPYIDTTFAKQGGTLLVNQPVGLNNSNTIASYHQLNGVDDTTYQYEYALSFWVYLNGDSPSTNASYDKYTSLLNYGNKPNVVYKASDNTLMVVMQNNGEKAPGSVSASTSPPEYDDNGNIIIYKLQNFLLQKWNNIIINYNGGTLDIFVNGELVKSVIGVIPYMTYDTLIIGSDKGIRGNLCNLNYFKNALTLSQIYYLYGYVKNRNPPISSNSNQMISDLNKVSNPYGVSLPNLTAQDISTAIESAEEEAEDVESSTIDYLNAPLKPDYISYNWYLEQNGDPNNSY
jgi:hypothetical protein